MDEKELEAQAPAENPYQINYEDQKFKDVETQRDAALTENDKLYGDMISKGDKFYQDQIDASKQWQKDQTKLQNQQTDFAIQQIEQQKAQTEKDYVKEQSGAYSDWQKQKSDYGVNAEKEASNGLDGSGYSESSRVSMYNTYQNRVATAREAFGRAVQNYNNSITQARLQNSVALADIAIKTLQQQLELSLQGFQYQNQLLLAQADKKMQIQSLYQSNWLAVLDQMNKENSLAEQVRQYNESMGEQQRQFNFYNKLGEFASVAGSGGGGYYGGGAAPKVDKPKSGSEPYNKNAVAEKNNGMPDTLNYTGSLNDKYIGPSTSKAPSTSSALSPKLPQAEVSKKYLPNDLR